MTPSLSVASPAAQRTTAGAPLPAASAASVAWPKALFLHERQQLAGAAIGAGAELPAGAASSPRLRRYLTQAPFDHPAFLQARLAASAMDRATFESLILTPAAELAAAAEPPPWLRRLEHLYGAPRPVIGSDPVLTLIEPLLADAEARWRRELPPIFSGERLQVDLARLLPCLRAQLERHLSQAARRAVVLELHAARELGLLFGATGAERLHDFCRRLATPEGAFGFFASFPVLGRRLIEVEERFLEAGREMFRRLAADADLWPALLDDAGEMPRVLVATEAFLSDPHRGGRAVHFLEFEGGARLVYKPKSLAAESVFAGLLAWLEAREFPIELRALRVVDRGDYGWAELVERREVANAAEQHEFYRRQGAFLALLHALHAVDFHHENLIAAGAFPLLIDLECLFHPSPEGLEGPLAELADTVQAVGFLPQRSWDDEGSDGLDISGLGAAARQKQAQPRLQDLGSDRMFFGQEVVELPAPQSVPLLAGVEPRLEDFAADLLAGFRITYRFLTVHRRALLAADGPLVAFANVELRVLLRASTAYAALLATAGHPHLLADALDTDLHFDRLWAVLPSRPWLRPVIEDERAALLRGDVPHFTRRAGDRDLYTCGGRRLPDYFAESGLAQVRRRLAEFCEADLELQERIIAGSLQSVALGRQARFWPKHQLRPRPAAAAGDFLGAAVQVAERLVALEARRPEAAYFFAQRPTGGDAYSFEPTGLDLYRGQAGIALFYAQLFACTGERRWALAARRSASPVLVAATAAPQQLPRIGGYCGWASLGLALERLGELLDDPAYREAASRIPAKIAALLAGDRSFDLLGGAAGAALYLLRRAGRQRDQEAARLAVAAGDHLLANVHRQEHGWAWPSPSGDAAGLTGFSHGTAGIAWALFELANFSGEARFAEAAHQALRYERFHFRPAAGNWLDLRVVANEEARLPAGQEAFMCAWCNGAVGIGYSRLLILPLLQGDARAEVEEELAIAARTTLREGFGRNHSLCHGDLGSLDFLLEVARRRGDRQLRRQVDENAAGLLASFEQDGWRCGLSNGVEHPGLLIGLAGIGYGSLRLAFPEKVPSVLTLAWH